METYTTRELEQRVQNPQCREADVEAAVEMGIPYSAYLDITYDPDKDGELSSEDEVRTGFEVALDVLDMTTECNPAAGIWPTRCEDVLDNPAKMVALREMALNTYRSVIYTPSDGQCCASDGTA